MQADAARTYRRLTTPVPPGDGEPVEHRRNRRKNTIGPGRRRDNDEGPGP